MFTLRRNCRLLVVSLIVFLQAPLVVGLLYDMNAKGHEGIRNGSIIISLIFSAVGLCFSFLVSFRIIELLNKER